MCSTYVEVDCYSTVACTDVEALASARKGNKGLNTTGIIVGGNGAGVVGQAGAYFPICEMGGAEGATCDRAGTVTSGAGTATAAVGVPEGADAGAAEDAETPAVAAADAAEDAETPAVRVLPTIGFVEEHPATLGVGLGTSNKKFGLSDVNLATIVCFFSTSGGQSGKNPAAMISR